MLFSVPVLADDPLNVVCDPVAANNSAVCQGRQGSTVNNPINVTIANVIQILIMVIAFAAVITIIVSGFRYITSSGNPETTNSAKNAILFALIGLAIALLAQALVTFVLRKL